MSPYLWTVKQNDMKTLLASLLIVIASNANAQTTTTNDSKGLEFEVQTGLKYVGRKQHFTHVHEFYEGPTERLELTDHDQNIGISSDIQFGYRFNQKWSAGATAGFIFWFDHIDFFIPRFGGSASTGLYGTYHFNDRFSLFSSVGIRKIPEQKFGGTFKIAPQLKFGKKQRLAFRVGTEVYYAKRDNEFYSGFFETPQHPGLIFDARGQGPSTTIGWIHEASLSFTIGD